MHTTILLADKVLFEGATTQLDVPATEGYVQILPQHAPLVAQIGQGALRYKTKDKTHTLHVQSGMLHVRANQIVVLLEALKPTASEH